MLAAVLGVLQALPQLLTMLQQFASWINRVSGNDPAGFINKAAPVFSQLAAAQTQEEHANAAKNLADLIRSLPAK